MKKLLALFLLLAMLVPMCVVAQAEGAATKPFYVVNMTTAPSADVSYVYTHPVFWAMPIKEENPIIKVTWGDSSPDIYNYDVDNVPMIAASLKAQFDAQPEGTRYVLMEALSKAFKDTAEDVLFMETGVALFSQWFDRFLKEFKAIGGELDGIMLDLEYENAMSWFLYERVYNKDESIYNRIVQNPKYQTLIRPHLVDRGFKFYESVTEQTPEIYSIYPYAGEEYTRSRGIWEAVVRDMLNQYINQACEPLFNYYPDAVLVDYQSKNTYGWLKDNELDGGMSNGSGNINHTVGNRASEDAYNVRPRVGFFKTTSNMNGYNNAVYENTPFNSFLADANTFKLTAEAAKDGAVSFWITDWRYNDENPNSVSRTPYYSEVILHAAMLNPDPIFGYIIPQEIVGVGNNDDPDYTHAIEIADDIMAELTRVLGAADRKAILIPSDWNNKFVISGMYAGGKNYWRITPDTTVVSLENFKVEGSDPTFSIAGKTVTFPGGKIIEDGNVREVGTCGYWVETAADVSPIVTVEDNYYYNYPAFEENFDQYEAGTDINSATVQPADGWEIKKPAKSSGTIQKDGDNGALAITGKFTLTNTKIPSYIYAVDTFAKHQGWELDVTVPADMAADAEIVLLNCVGQKTKSDDVGMKIAGGKLYYDNAGQYVELADVTLTPGSKYTVKRVMDMTVDGAFTSDYYLFDATGALLGSVEDIPLTNLTGPITAISMGCKNIVGEPVILDNYKLYITDANTNFELYDAGNGMRVEDITVARDKDTAYRLTYVNATQTEKTYSVVAAYYNGESLVSEQVVKEIKVAPNTDGVVTGVVKNETAGQTLLVYLKDNTPADDNGGADAKKVDWLLIGGAVLVVAVLGELVYLMLSMNKKKKKKAAKKAVKKAPKTDKPTEE